MLYRGSIIHVAALVSEKFYNREDCLPLFNLLLLSHLAFFLERLYINIHVI